MKNVKAYGLLLASLAAMAPLGCGGNGESNDTSSGSSTGGNNGSTSSSSSSGSSSSSSNSTGATCTPPITACTTCQQELCTSLDDSFTANPACTAWKCCVLACPTGDNTCAGDCLETNNDCAATGWLLDDCSARECADECPGATTLTPCQVCWGTQCPDEVDVCWGNAACLELAGCWSDCKGNAACVQVCNAVFSAGLSDGQALLTCITANCQSECL